MHLSGLEMTTVLQQLKNYISKLNFLQDRCGLETFQFSRAKRSWTTSSLLDICYDVALLGQFTKERFIDAKTKFVTNIGNIINLLKKYYNTTLRLTSVDGKSLKIQVYADA